MKNIKDKLTTVCALLIAVCTAVFALPSQGVVLPTWAIPVATVTAGVCGAIIAYFSGKNPNGTKKSQSQVDTQNRK